MFKTGIMTVVMTSYREIMASLLNAYDPISWFWHTFLLI